MKDRRRFLVRLPRRLTDGEIRLRPLRIFDGPFLRRALRQREVLEANGLREPIDGSWLDVWWWLRKAFVVSYCIEIDSRRSGFAGVYDLLPGQYAEISLTLFDRGKRGQGYGSRVFAMIERSLERQCLVEKVIARVKADNHAAKGFWKGVGFHVEESLNHESVTLMSKNLGNDLSL